MNKEHWKSLSGYACQLGECPVWDSRNQRLLWVDILGGDVHQYHYKTRRHSKIQVGDSVGSITLCKSGRILAAIGNRFGLISGFGDPVETLAVIEAPGENRFNDGKCDPDGRFWVGSMDKQARDSKGFLMVLHPDLHMEVVLQNLTVPNGMAWSPDNKVFYFIDTPRQNISAFDFDRNSGRITNGRVVIEIPGECGKPDGMTIDRNGMLWIALWDGAAIMQWDPIRSVLLRSIPLPVSRPTSCTFGGRNFDTLFVTSARLGLTDHELEEQPRAGETLVIEHPGTQGMDPFRFQE